MTYIIMAQKVKNEITFNLRGLFVLILGLQKNEEPVVRGGCHKPKKMVDYRAEEGATGYQQPW